MAGPLFCALGPRDADEHHFSLDRATARAQPGYPISLLLRAVEAAGWRAVSRRRNTERTLSHARRA